MTKLLINPRSVLFGLTILLASCYTPVIAQEMQVNAQANMQEQQAPPVDYQTFYNELAPYGQWVHNPVYGYVWLPAAGPGFVPYATDGHWVYTEMGWTWVSDYPWGWACFHYGRWENDSFFGWFWIPGYEWAPAWVSWRSSPGYYGWAPLGPTYAASGYGTYYIPPERYIYVQNQYITSPVVYSYYAPREQNEVIMRNSTLISTSYIDNTSHRTYYGGPPREEVEHITNQRVTPVMIRQSNSPGQASQSGNEIRMYHPAIANPENSPQAIRPAPPRASQLGEVKNPQEREVLTKPVPAMQLKPMEQQKPIEQPRQVEQQRQIEQPKPIEQPKQVEQPRQAPPPANNNQPQQNKGNNNQNQNKKPKPVKQQKPVPPKQPAQGSYNEKKQ